MYIKKNLVVIIFIILCSSSLFPQEALNKGVYNISGSIIYSNSKNTMLNGTTKFFNFSFSPAFNYFVVDNLLVGGSVSFFYSEFNFESTSGSFNNISKQFGIGPGIRYYFRGSSIIPFIGASANYSKSINSKQESKTVSVMIGIDYFLSKSVAVEPYLNYSFSSHTMPDQDINTFSVGIRMNYFIIN